MYRPSVKKVIIHRKGNQISEIYPKGEQNTNGESWHEGASGLSSFPRYTFVTTYHWPLARDRVSGRVAAIFSTSIQEFYQEFCNHLDIAWHWWSTELMHHIGWSSGITVSSSTCVIICSYRIRPGHRNLQMLRLPLSSKVEWIKNVSINRNCTGFLRGKYVSFAMKWYKRPTPSYSGSSCQYRVPFARCKMIVYGSRPRVNQHVAFTIHSQQRHNAQAPSRRLSVPSLCTMLRCAQPPPRSVRQPEDPTCASSRGNDQKGFSVYIFITPWMARAKGAGFSSRCTQRNSTLRGKFVVRARSEWRILPDTDKTKRQRTEWRSPCQIAEIRMEPYRPDDHAEAEAWGDLYQELTTLPLKEVLFF